MSIGSSKVPDDLNYAVLVAIAGAVIGTIQQISEMNILGIVIAVACTAAIYGLVYNNLATDVSTAKGAALVLAIVFGFFLFVSLQRGHSLFLFLNLVVVGCLGYTFMRLSNQSQ